MSSTAADARDYLQPLSWFRQQCRKGHRTVHGLYGEMESELTDRNPMARLSFSPHMICYEQ